MNKKETVGFWDIVKYFLRINDFRILSCYPGSNSSGLIDDNDDSCGININEKIAYEIAYGSSLAEKRSAVSMKNVGLNVCADSFLNSIQTGTKAPLFLFVIDDVKVFSSQNKQDSRYYFDFFGGLCFEPNSLEDLPLLLNTALRISIKSNTPCVFRITNDLLNLSIENIILKSCEKIYSHSFLNIEKSFFLTHPKNWKLQETWKRQRFEIIHNLLRESKINKYPARNQKSKVLNVIVGASSCIDSHDSLILRAYPLNYSELGTLFSSYKEIRIHELGSSYIFDKVKHLHNNVVSTLDREYDNTNRIFFSDRYQSIFKEISKLEDKIVFGDLNMFSNESEDIYDSILCLGGSIGPAMGASLAGKKNVFAILGDGGFIHSGFMSYLESSSRSLNITILVIDNGGSHSTGGHNLPVNLASILPKTNVLRSKFKNLDSKSVFDNLQSLKAMAGTKLWLITDEEYKNDKFK